ncbi:TonB-dependent receptor plug domain-containing protein [Frateuria soli]|uniref:TonB-dependent receptor plug domain-containing protein n=1 Tax=Frateuria soli TaxID=1542730 RepID=UPI001E2D461C|nr:TonB-dependent receptor [Frateuria soli]UGB37878.1 TonB-dependent receptor [Frateuria soli]
MKKVVQRGLRRLPLAVAVIAALQVVPVFAQDQSPSPAQSTESTGQPSTTEKAKNLETITVTGSLLKRPEYETTAPVQVIEIENNIAAGQFDTADFLQTSAAAAGSTQINGQFGGYIVEGGTGVQTVNLRGLGANRTLILLDGQRPGPAGVRGQVGAFDLNVIPQVILSRIEIVKDGSSSIYGSDALSGVVNLITKKNIDRPEMTFAASVPQHGGGEQYTGSFGTGWNFKNGSVVAAVQLDKLEALELGDRDFLKCNRDMVWGTDGQRIDREDRSILAGSSLAGCNNLYANSIIWYLNSRVRYVPSADGSTVGPFPGYHPRPYPTPRYDTNGQAYYEDVLNYPFMNDAYVINQRKRASVYAATDFSFGSVNWKTQWLFNHRESKDHSYRQFFPLVSDGPMQPDLSNVYEPIMPFPDDGTEKVNYLYGTTKLEGLFSSTDSWSWEVNAGYSRSSGDYTHRDIDVAKTGDLSYDDSGEASVDYFDPGILSGERMGDLVNAIGAWNTGHTLYTQATANALLTGNLFTLPAGDVASAFGVEYRHYKIDDVPSDFTLASRAWGYTSAQRTHGTDNVREIFGEVDVPLLKGIPAIESLSVNMSGRVFKYGSVDSRDQVWKTGLNWQITPTFRIRGTLGTSYRAPGLYELYLGDQTGFQSQTTIDPCILWGDSTNDRLRANCAAAGIPADYSAGGASSATIHSGGGKGHLEAETSRAKSLGFAWSPDFANLNLAVDYFDYDVRGEITNLDAGDVISGCYLSSVYPNSFCDQIVRKPSSDPSTPFMITDVYGSYININRERTRGYDLQVNYAKDFSFGKLSADAQVTYTIEDTTLLFSTAEASGFSRENQVGFIGRPKTVGISDLSLERGDWTFAWQGRYVSTTSAMDLDPTFNYSGYAGATRDIKAGWQLLHSVSVAYEKGHWGAMFGVRNLFDKKPDQISASAGTVIGNTPLYASQYDWYGRTFFARLNYKF